MFVEKRGVELLERGVTYFKSVFVILLLTLLFFLYTSQLYAADSPRNIIILNSYHQGLFWTDDEMKGILDILKNADNDYNISVEYMDWKRYATYENLSKIKEHLKYKYSSKKTDLIITTDDAALEFALSNRADDFSDGPVVFCGVDKNSAEKLTKDQTNVTGFIQKNNPLETVKAALKINSDIKRVYLVYDNTESGQSTGNMIIDAINEVKPSIELALMDNTATGGIFEEVSHAQKDSVVITTNYQRDIDGNMVGFEYFSKRLSQSSSVPVYSLYEGGIGNGIIGGSLISGIDQGKGVAGIAIRVLNGEDISTIPQDESSTTHLIFDYNELKRFDIDTRLVPKGSEIVNKPVSMFIEHKSEVIAATIIFILLVIFILILLFYLKKINVMKDNLSKTNIELLGLNDNLSSAEVKLRQQFNELQSMQKDLVSSEHRFALLFEKMLNGFFIGEPVLGNDGGIMDIRFKKVNPAFYKQTGKLGIDVIGKNWFEVFGYTCKELGIFRNLMNTGGTERFETYYTNQDTHYAGYAFAITENEIGVVFDNITEYKTAIKEVKLLNTGLEQRVRERTNELQLALDELELFSFTVSHDLKSPLRAIDGYSKIILEDMDSRLDADSTEILCNIGKISREMINMINQLLEYSTTARDEINKEGFDIKENMISVFNELRLIHPEREINLVIETGMPVVCVDKVLFRQLLQNIFSNAIKFTKDRDRSIITAGCTITQDKYIFYVKDNGVGFDMEYSGKLFGIFQRLHTNEEFEGSGIGLVSVRKIIEKHAGSVWIEGKVDEGATLFFTLPFSWDNTLHGVD
jgi:signal transduction histidine kinase/ABC-type uncharacterized transport system substrate-binding protein